MDKAPRMHSGQMNEIVNRLADCRWGVNVVAFVITAVLGEWLCLRREMQDIPIGEIVKPPFHYICCLSLRMLPLAEALLKSGPAPARCR